MLSNGNGQRNRSGSGAEDGDLDAKMRQLSGLLQGGNPKKQSKDSDSANGTSNGHDGHKEGANGYNSGNIASTLQAMFPHATIRTGRDDLEKADGEKSKSQENGGSGGGKNSEADAADVDAHMKRLERSVDSVVDDRALMSLQSLPYRDAKEALRKVEELVVAQGGQCRNLSSILQSVCRKLEKRSKPIRHDEELPYRSMHSQNNSFPARTSAPTGTADTNGSHNRKSGNEEDSEKSENKDKPTFVRTSSGGLQSPNGTNLDTPAGRRSWADIGDQDEDDEEASIPLVESATPKKAEDGWTQSLVESRAQKGFQLKKTGKDIVLRLNMSNLEPPLSESAMEMFCEWLRKRLEVAKKEHGLELLRRCNGEVDFSQNNMTNQMVWILLETLAQFEVHTAVLKLNSNQISQGGALAIAEFIHASDQAEVVYELDLSHNEIDDESALELLRTLHAKRPRYPPKREDSSGKLVHVPVWVRLNHNRIQSPDQVRKTAEGEGITMCFASDRQACATTKCWESTECPLVHLCSFSLQVGKADSNGNCEIVDESNDDPNGAFESDFRSTRRKRDKRKEKA
eukprot:TRINITY_DN21428_c0_g1_i3.p1 TRINITY_DN21428_c0_g1~~TRINITY_DN21428_c0_g1_i3.p1  ORF type:complete len:571 (-),score=107.13 TRINITY_DN21428_c0_g1_i3:203-1915(-)